jgi:hypothetical protein
VLALVVCWDGDVHVCQLGVSVAECDGGDVHVGRLLDGLVVGAGVGQHQQAGLLELFVKKGGWREGKGRGKRGREGVG